jgi:hypothetical protein
VNPGNHYPAIMSYAWINYPTVLTRIKRAAGPATPPAPSMYVAPERATPAGPTGYNMSTGYRDNPGARSFLEHNIPDVARVAIPQAGRERAHGGVLPTLAGAAAGLGTSYAVGKPVDMLATKLLSKVPLPGYAKLLRPALAYGAGAYAAVRPMAAAVSGTVQRVGDASYNFNPEAANTEGMDALLRPASQLAQAGTTPRHNPIQLFLQQMNSNPNARNALLGLGAGGLGGLALGSAAGHPWLGALLGLLGGGYAGGRNPQWGAKPWQSFYENTWNQADKMNNRVAVPSPTTPQVTQPA